MEVLSRTTCNHLAPSNAFDYVRGSHVATRRAHVMYVWDQAFAAAAAKATGLRLGDGPSEVRTPGEEKDEEAYRRLREGLDGGRVFCAQVH
ncbi:hypothetical protein CSOJ01_11262 [Colletotrichum sojae]|uniref:Uncharacterized protein n=1 Tax=Colletotrichum sojae TaxID=2175907 RepID=A0A8H6MN49_9PEZI|nr:hypothetical protein CSOJ01_11262 [Colletotrichum sojae]